MIVCNILSACCIAQHCCSCCKLITWAVLQKQSWSWFSSWSLKEREKDKKKGITKITTTTSAATNQMMAACNYKQTHYNSSKTSRLCMFLLMKCQK